MEKNEIPEIQGQPLNLRNFRGKTEKMKVKKLETKKKKIYIKTNKENKEYIIKIDKRIK